MTFLVCFFRDLLHLHLLQAALKQIVPAVCGTGQSLPGCVALCFANDFFSICSIVTFELPPFKTKMREIKCS